MPNIFSKIKHFLTKDVKNESESKDLAVLLRLLCIVTSLYILFNSIYFAINASYFFAILSIPIICLYVGVFIETYENKTKFALHLFNYTTIVTSIVFTLFTGWDKNYQWLLCIVCMLIFFSVDADSKFKINNMEIILITLVAISILSHLIGVHKTGSQGSNIYFSIITAAYYGSAISLISFNFSKKFNASELKLRSYNQKLQEMASLDALTLLPNRRSMNEYLSQLVFEKEKKGDIFCIAIADLDFFKKVNDQYGHEAGDFILKETAKILQMNMEGRGKVSRWGGEEFLFCFDNLNMEQSFKILDEIRSIIESRKFIYKGNEIKITITIGLEEYYHISGIEGTISNADKKLYKGKSSGRNRVVT
ncbi:MAG: GGDEF domain-containing protein [Lachnospiraceae bacterium]|nr:GGDEF domain-containing protein [Lachnospiraceae bacterium]